MKDDVDRKLDRGEIQLGHWNATRLHRKEMSGCLEALHSLNASGSLQQWIHRPGREGEITCREWSRTACRILNHQHVWP